MRLITDVLRDIRRGKVVEVASEKLQEVVQGVMDTQKSGSLTLKITVKPRGRDENSLIVGVKLTQSIPQQTCLTPCSMQTWTVNCCGMTPRSAASSLMPAVIRWIPILAK
jgi:hypothetical protein